MVVIRCKTNELIRLQNIYLIRKCNCDLVLHKLIEKNLPLIIQIDNMNISIFVPENIKQFSEFLFKVYISQIDENNNK